MEIDLLTEAIKGCLRQMYKKAQPPADFDNLPPDSKEYPIYQRHYLSKKAYKVIEQYFIDTYQLSNDFPSYCDLLENYLVEGGPVEVYVKEKGKPGFRDYEQSPKISDVISSEDVEKVLKLIHNCKEFYNSNYRENQFRFNVANYSPTSNKQTVIDYWKSQDIDIEIVDYDDDYMYERYILDWSEEDIDEDKDFCNREKYNDE